MFKKYFRNKKREQRRRSFTAGAFIGSILGAIAAVFITPVSGKKAREETGKKIKQGGDWIRQESGKLTEKASEVRETISKKGKELLDKVQDKPKANEEAKKEK